MEIKKSNGIEFVALDPSDLEPVSVVAQCLDNQWVPNALLARMVEENACLRDVEIEREGFARAEYLRALINARQVVVNRAYLFNNPVVFRDMLHEGASRDAFKELIGQGAIVPYMFKEASPEETPGFSTDPRGLPAWRRVCEEVKARCIRLSWDDDENGKFADDKLARRFHDFALTMSSGDPDVFARDLELAQDAKPAFSQRLLELATAVLEVRQKGKFVAREDLYSRFVTADGTSPSDGHYDKDKPFAAALKRLLDLSYNVNLPDALGGYALTPVDSLQRTALQEWQTRQAGREISADDLVELIKQSTFSLVQGGLFLKSFGKMDLDDVRQIRLTDEWAGYIRSVEQLMADPLSFANPETGAAAIYGNYVKMAQRATEQVARKRATGLTARWEPGIELVLNVAGAILSAFWPPAAAGPVFNVVGQVSSRTGEKASPFAARLLIRGFSKASANADLSSSIEFMTGRLSHAREKWEQIIRQLAEIKGAQPSAEEPKDIHHATINQTAEAHA